MSFEGRPNGTLLDEMPIRCTPKVPHELEMWKIMS